MDVEKSKKHVELNESKKEHSAAPTMDLVMAITKDIGQFGLYQFRLIAMSALVAIFVAWNTNQFVFTAARITTRCFIPECEQVGETEFVPDWIENAIPGSRESFDNCNRFAPRAGDGTGPGFNETCPAELFDNQTIVSCDSHLYENTHSVVYDYGLACDEWRRSLVGTVRTAGTLVALPLTGYISDRWGRRPAMVLNIVTAATIGLLRLLAQTYAGFVTSQFFEAFGFGALSCAYIMSMEIVGNKYRVAAAATNSSFFAIGQVILAAIAWALPYWRHLTSALYAPQFVILAYLWIMPENFRWYVSKGRYDEAEKIAMDAARVNKKQISEESKMALRKAADNSKYRTETKDKESWLIVLVFKHKPILLRCIATPIWWISTMAVYYGLTINAIHLAGNQYQNFMLVAAVEIPGFWMAVFLMNTIGRRPVLLIGFWVCAACMVGSIFASTEAYALSLTLYLVGKCCISMVVVAIHLYTAELYPTKHRHSLFAFSSMMGRLGHIVAPLTPAFSEEIWENLPFALFAVLSVISGCLVFLTPETLGENMPDTMEQAVDLGSNRNRKREI